MTFRRRWSECHKEHFSGREDGEAGLLSGASPAALQPARRLSWLASERARLCLSLPTQSKKIKIANYLPTVFECWAGRFCICF